MLTGAYAADALGDSERDLFEDHLRECAACRDEVVELTATASRLASAAATPVPAGLKAKVLAELAHTRQLPPLAEVGRLDGHRSRRWYQQPGSVAAALMLVVSAGLATYAVEESRQAERATERAERATAIATDRDRVEHTAPISNGGTGTVVAADGAAIFRTTRLDRLPDDRVYQLWVLRDDRLQSAGVLGRGGELDAVVTELDPTDQLGLTVEPDGGSTSPTGDLVLRIDVA